MTSLAVLRRDALRHEGTALLQPLAHLAQRGRVESEFPLQIFDAARPGAFEMAHQARTLVIAALRLLECGAAEGVNGARALG
jgi:hypothetical protein